MSIYRHFFDKVYSETVILADKNHLLELMNFLTETELKNILLNSNEIDKARILIKFEEYAANKDKEIIQYIFNNEQEKANFLIKLCGRIKALLSIKKLNYPDNAVNQKNLDHLIENLYFIYAVEGGDLFEIEESGNIFLQLNRI